MKNTYKTCSPTHTPILATDPATRATPTLITGHRVIVTGHSVSTASGIGSPTNRHHYICTGSDTAHPRKNTSFITVSVSTAMVVRSSGMYPSLANLTSTPSARGAAHLTPPSLGVTRALSIGEEWEETTG